MYALYERHYDATDRKRFEADLSGKDLVLLIRNGCGDVVGFSTLSFHSQPIDCEEVFYLFSGDTILDAPFWGNSILLRTWFEVAGAVKRQMGSRRLYWFLIVKGHRTYRILPNFFSEYVPAPNMPPAHPLLPIRDAIATARYGGQFSPETGLIDFGKSLGHLRPEWSGAEEAALRNSHAAAFVKLNPYHQRGVELACLTELAPGNLKRYASGCFAAGWSRNDIVLPSRPFGMKAGAPRVRV
jgi:hypothetical protein